MVDLAPGSVVKVVNPEAVVRISSPGLVKGLVLKEGPTGAPGADGMDGRSITTIARTSGTGAAGTTDTYTITYSDATTSTFNVYNGANGTGDVASTRAINTTNGLQGGGNLTADRTLSPVYGTAANTVAQGNDSRITGAAQTANNLSDLASATTARTNLALGTAATANTGTTSGTLPLLGTGGVLPIARLATGTPDGTKFIRDDGTLAAVSGGSSTALARKVYDPAANTDTTTNSTTAVDVDATNLVVSFTVPASGAVRVVFEAMTLGATNNVTFWTVREGTTDLNIGRPTVFGGLQIRSHVEAVITGLTPGAAKTWKWAHYGSGGTAYTVYGGGRTAANARGPAVMEVYAA
jgi:hypothetical protein